MDFIGNHNLLQQNLTQKLNFQTHQAKIKSTLEQFNQLAVNPIGESVIGGSESSSVEGSEQS